MTREEWTACIRQSCEDAGTYRPFFDQVIDTLASILERRDKAEEIFRATGSNVVVGHTNKAGATNLEQNPVLRLVNDLNRDALTYWRDLGLTPAGYRKLNADVVKVQGGGNFEKLFAKILE